MAYSVRITRVGYDGDHALYAWQSTTGASGYVGVDLGAPVTFQPTDASGVPTGAMSFRRGDSDVANPEAETVSDFLTAVSGIIKRWRETEPPETAHLYFG